MQIRVLMRQSGNNRVSKDSLIRAFSLKWAARMHYLLNKESVYNRKEFNCHTISLVHRNVTDVLLCWNTNVTAITSGENTLFVLLIIEHAGSGLG